MIYRDERRRIDGVWNRRVPWTAERHIQVFAEGGLEQLVAWLDRTPRKWKFASSTKVPTDMWDLNCGYDGALKLAKDGWQEGVDRIDGSLHAFIPAAGQEGRWGWACHGSSVSVTRFITGNPRCMRSRTRKDRGKAPVLHLVLNPVASCAVKADQMANYGAAITGLVERLEASGRRVQLDAVMAVNANGIRLAMGWNVKQAGQQINMSAVAFSLAHPAAFRRFGFAIMERLPTETQTASYGFSADLSHEDVVDGNERTLLIDGISHEPTRCNTMKDAVRFAIEQLNKAAVIAGHATIDAPLIADDEEMLRDVA